MLLLGLTSKPGRKWQISVGPHGVPNIPRRLVKNRSAGRSLASAALVPLNHSIPWRIPNSLCCYNYCSYVSAEFIYSDWSDATTNFPNAMRRECVSIGYY